MRDIFILCPEGEPEGLPSSGEQSPRTIHLETASILETYDPDFRRKADEDAIYEFYLGVLFESWLDDLAHHWKSANPPASERLSEIGLLTHLQGGVVWAGSQVDDDPLY